MKSHESERERERENMRASRMKHNPHKLEDTFGKGNTAGFVQIFKTPDVPTACTGC